MGFSGSFLGNFRFAGFAICGRGIKDDECTVCRFAGFPEMIYIGVYNIIGITFN